MCDIISFPGSRLKRRRVRFPTAGRLGQIVIFNGVRYSYHSEDDAIPSGAPIGEGTGQAEPALQMGNVPAGARNLLPLGY
ncbi:hypothetical protein [Labrys sp. ZIDIC5]|uniref:hypothetical protein n=1 Tax=Labrys sedimenti TaxID=3106036 RepID=UPI002ACAF5C0|nr:hypothetical protein [Labrys sp. ZIDIC5]MDZ5454753.1 hypothetical protein [Labrys sp. ZIDIC5]